MKEREYRLGKNIFEKHTLFVKTDGLMTQHILAIESPDRMSHTAKIINVPDYTIFDGDWDALFLKGTIKPIKDYDGTFSDSYVRDKIRYGTTQELLEFDVEGTIGEINNLLEDAKDPESDSGMGEEDIEYLNELLEFIDSDNCEAMLGVRYEVFALDNATPYFANDYDLLPFCRKLKYNVNVYFDAYEEMCYRLKDGNFVDLSENKNDV